MNVRVVTIAMLVAAAAPAFASTPATAPARTASPAGEIPAKLLRDLASDDFNTRAAAQKALAQVPADRRGELERLGAQTDDPEVKARLRERVTALETEALLHLPIVSLDLKQANLAEAAAALSKAVNVPMIGRDPNDNSGHPITLSIKEASFCQAIEAIAAQTPLVYAPSANGVSLVGPNHIARPQPLPPPQACGPVLIFPQVARVGQTVAIGVTMFVDPRLQTVGSLSFVPSAKDAKGNKLKVIASNRGAMAGSGPNGTDDYARINQTTWMMTLAAPEDRASKITITGEVQVRVVTQYERGVINEPEKHLREVEEIGGWNVSILEFSPEKQQRSTNLRVNITAKTDGEGAAGRGPGETPARFFLVDAKGRQIADVSAAGMVVKGIPQAAINEAQKPFRVEISVPAKVDTVTVPVEIKDL